MKSNQGRRRRCLHPLKSSRHRRDTKEGEGALATDVKRRKKKKLWP